MASSFDSLLESLMGDGGVDSPLLSYDGDPNDSNADVLKAQWERYVDLYTPIEDALIGSLGDSTTGEATEQAGAAADRSVAATQRLQSRYGLSSLDPELTERQNSIDRSLATSSAYNTAAVSDIDRRDTIRSSLVNVGQGILNQATGGLSQAASMQNSREAANAQAEAQADAQRNSTYASLGSAALLAAFAF